MHNKNCVKSSDVPSTPPQSQEVHIPESNDLYIAKETNQGFRSSYKIFEEMIIGQLNINYLRNKFDLLTYQSKDFIDILMITERKLHESFPIG